MTTSLVTPEIVLPHRETYLEAVKDKPRAPRKKSRYDTDVRSVLDKYRHRYRKLTTTQERRDLLRNYILVDMFNFWYERGEVTPDIAEDDLCERIKVWSKLNIEVYHIM